MASAVSQYLGPDVLREWDQAEAEPRELQYAEGVPNPRLLKPVLQEKYSRRPTCTFAGVLLDFSKLLYFNTASKSEIEQDGSSVQISALVFSACCDNGGSNSHLEILPSRVFVDLHINEYREEKP